jgi:hypothetical protein
MSPPEGGAALTVEELAVRLASYAATPADLPPGVRLAGASVDTPATLAPLVAPLDNDPRGVFAGMSRDFRLRIQQTTMSSPDGPPNFAVSIQLMTGTEVARAFLGDPARRPANAETLAVEEPLGEANVAWRWTRTRPDGVPLEDDAVRWQRGPLLFEVAAQGSPGRVSLADALAVATRVDARVVSIPPALTAPPTFVPYVTEEERLEAFLRLQTLDFAPERVPAGYRPFQATRIAHPASEALTRVLAGGTPADALAALAEARRVLTWSAAFVPIERRDAPVSLVAWLTADDDAAARQLAGLATDPPRAEVTRVPPPLALGDETIAARSRTPDFYGPGDDLVVYRFGWRHGPLVLAVIMEGEAEEATVVAFGRALEQAYAASPFAVDAAAGPDGGRTVSFISGGEVVRAELFRPDGDATGLPAVVVLHGCDGPPDFRDVAEAYALRDAIEAAGGEHELAIYPGGGHSWPGAQGAEALERTVAFLRRHVAVETPPR